MNKSTISNTIKTVVIITTSQKDPLNKNLKKVSGLSSVESYPAANCVA